MQLKQSRIFIKQFNRLPIKIQNQFQTRLELWLIEPNHSQLHTHPLVGGYSGYWSFNVTGDVRALYYFEGETVVVFAFIGKHGQSYK
jgi:addiction module RelE/StbE family toxin